MDPVDVAREHAWQEWLTTLPANIGQAKLLTINAVERAFRAGWNAAMLAAGAIRAER